MPYENEVPQEIASLSQSHDENRPYGPDTYGGRAMAAHLRALYAFIAQLRDRVEELEKRLADARL